MKSIDHDLRYDGASSAQVHAMLADRAFRERALAAQGVQRSTVTITPSGQRMSVTLDQVRTAAGVPGFATRFVGDEINIVQQEEWSSATAATVTVRIPGKPGEMNGDISLVEDASGTTERVRLTVKVAIPLVGGRIEGLIVDLLTKALRAENSVGREWLGQQG